MNSPTTAITRTRPTPRTASRRRSAAPSTTAAFSVATGRHSPDSPERTRAEWQHDGQDGMWDSDGAPGLACRRPVRSGTGRKAPRVAPHGRRVTCYQHVDISASGLALVHAVTPF